MEQTQTPVLSLPLSSFAKRFGIFNAVLCGLTVFYVVVAVNSSNSLAAHIALIGVIPRILIPVGLCCLVGAILSAGLALGKHANRDAVIGLLLSLASPLITIACYAMALVSHFSKY